jgi:hypothetical protein
MSNIEYEELERWLQISGAMLHQLIPAGAGVEAFGHGMLPGEFAAMMDSESDRVDHALVALATASNESEVKSLFSQLSQPTRTALFARWAHYTENWRALKQQKNPSHWFPPRDLWRAVFLSMTSENWYSTETARSLWPEAF